ncbi:MAG: sulfite exporter TauE/SafE family protein [bacterium]|nr:sulfite exporter TauE/SafE family protein [bacterium]
MAKQQFFVQGTSCKSCEVIIERELKKQSDIVSVDVSHVKRQITIKTLGDRRYSHEEIQTILEKFNYTVGTKDQSRHQIKPAINWQGVGAAAIFVLSLYIILDRLGLLRLSPSSAEPASLIGILVIGFIASLSSCTAVVGGLVATVSSAVAKDQVRMSSKERFMPHILFNGGRILGFFIFGALIGYAGSALQLSPALNGIFVVVIAILMIIIGINLMGVFPAPLIGVPKWLAHRVHAIAESKDPKAPMVLGAMTFFLPCGFTQSMQLFALTLQDPIQSGLVLAVFAFGTSPVLLGIGGAISYASGNTLKNITQFAGVIVLILGISNVGNGFALLGVTADRIFAKSTQTGASGGVLIVNGRQQIEMDMTSRGLYDPDVLSVQEGIPVDWIINGDDFMGCGDTLIMPAFGINTTLKTGPNLVQFTPTKTGRYPFSCSMGMIRGTMVVTPAS